MNIKKDILWRVYLAFGIICLAGLLVILKSFSIQFFEKVEGKTWKEFAQDVTKADRAIPALRGNVYSEDKNLLATSYPVYELRFDAVSSSDANFYLEVDSLAEVLSNYFGKRTKEEELQRLQEAREKGSRYLLIARKVTYPQFQEIKEFPLFRLGKYKGGFIKIQKNKRIRPFNRLAHRTIGYVREDISVGIEGNYDSLLSGVEGRRWEQKIAGGKWIPISDHNLIDPIDGADLQTTLDTYIQDIADNALIKALEKHKADHGCVVVMEVSTGKIKAISNLGVMPSGNYGELYNYAVGESTEPGSTMKLATLIAALEDGNIKIDDSVNIGNGSIDWYDRTMRDSDHKVSGSFTVKQSFANSSNVALSKIAVENFSKDPAKFVSYLKQIGLTDKVGIDIKGEPMPYVKDPSDKKSWTGITLPWMSTGYELTMVPIQMLSLYNAVANGGRKMRPYLVSKITQNGKEEVVKPVVLIDQICSKKTLRDVRLCLESVVSNGTASNIKSKHYQIAGKTSTALIADKKHGYKSSQSRRKVYQASFAGYFPADNPKYSCIVVVNAPSNGVYYGGYVAGPVFKEISDKIYAKKIMMEDRLSELANNKEWRIPYVKVGKASDIAGVYEFFHVQNVGVADADWVKPSSNKYEVTYKERDMTTSLVPNVLGMGLRDGVYLLENWGLSVKVTGKGVGKIRQQSLRPGSKIIKGREIEIKVS